MGHKPNFPPRIQLNQLMVSKVIFNETNIKFKGLMSTFFQWPKVVELLDVWWRRFHKLPLELVVLVKVVWFSPTPSVGRRRKALNMLHSKVRTNGTKEGKDSWFPHPFIIISFRAKHTTPVIYCCSKHTSWKQFYIIYLFQYFLRHESASVDYNEARRDSTASSHNPSAGVGKSDQWGPRQSLTWRLVFSMNTPQSFCRLQRTVFLALSRSLT